VNKNRIFNYRRAEFVRRGYWDSALNVSELAEAWNVDYSTILGILNDGQHATPKPEDESIGICTSCTLPECVYDLQNWPNKDMLQTCDLWTGKTGKMP
jgi:hypothetical protein